jgi:cell division protein FtsI (penicillin-binding protein 3)
MRPRQTTATFSITPLQRIRIWYALLLLVACVFVVRLFYLQVIRHAYYQTSAIRGQLKEYEIPATRGIIEAHSGGQVIPIVLNETKYTLFADPKFIKDPKAAAQAVQGVIGGKTEDIETKMRADTRYAVLAKKLSKDQKDKIDGLKLKGVGTRETQYRTYPQGTLAAQVLGFVNDEGDGKYGLEQALDSDLKGQPGLLKAITDAQGVPLATNKENILNDPTPGKRVILTIDLGMQQQLEDILKAGLDKAHSGSGGALIMEAQTGAIKAMANYPTYNPSEFYKIEDASVFTNAVVSAPLEVGSTMKPLTAAAALDQRVVSKNTTYFDPSRFKIGDATVTNIEEDGGPGTHSVADILQLSLNTGATWLLMQMGGGEINKQARERWYDYMVNHYQFGKLTGIEQGYESEGTIPDPNEGFGLNIQYANTAFGQGMTATPLQMGAALASIVNGGTYYRPHLVESTVDGSGKASAKQPEIVKKDVVKTDVGATIREFMEYTISKNYLTYGMKSPYSDYRVGGKTGTAEVPKPGGGYYDDRFNGTFIGFLGGGDTVQYVIVVRVNEPKIGGYAGSKAAAPIFGSLTDMLINNFGVQKRQ